MIKNKALTELVIPSTVTKINIRAFGGLTALKSLTFAEGSKLQYLGRFVFDSCSGLESITLPAMLNELQTVNETIKFGSVSAKYVISSLFVNCTSLKHVDMSACQELKEIPTLMFVNCTSIETLILPPNLETISNWAFGEKTVGSSDNNMTSALTSLKSIVIPASVTSIGGYAFSGCTSLETVIFEAGNTITHLGVLEEQATDPIVGKNIFAGTTALKTVVLPQNLIQIGMGCFENSGVAEIDLPSGVTHIGNRAFYECTNIVDPGLGANLIHLGDEAFCGCVSMENAELYPGLEYMGARAFAYCSSLKRAFIPATVTSISGNPFMGCSGVEEFELDPDSTSFVMRDEILYDKTMYTVLYYPASLDAETYEFPETVHAIGIGAFAGAQLKNITIPDRITSIPEYAFAASALENFTVHSGFTTIGAHAFEDCAQMNNVFIPNTLLNLGHYAFANCTGLNTIVFEDVIENGTPYNIGSHLFDGCTAMTQVIVPNKMTYIDDGTSNYKKVSDAYACIPAYMFANTGIVNAVIPAQITDLATEGVFANCAQLETVAYENMLLDSNNVGAKFFAGCTKIREIVIPLGVGTVSYGLGEYEGCTALEKVTFYSGDELVYCNSPSFLNCPNLKVIELVYVEDYETDETGKVTYTQTSQAHIATFNGSFFAGTGIEYFYSASPEIIFGGHDFENSIIKVVVLDVADITMFGEGDGYGIFSNAKELKEVWIAGGEEGLYFSEDVFITLDHDVNFYFTGYTYDEVVDMVGDSAWFTTASEYAHFYFKDTMPADVEWPEEIKPET